MIILRPVRFADFYPRAAIPLVVLLVAAALSLGGWVALEANLGRFTHPAYATMLRAAHQMEAATQVARGQRARLHLMQSAVLDPNRTGLIGAEYTDTTTSLGDPAAKRTATNPDLAAAIARRIVDLGIEPGSPVLIVVSGSFIGGNIAAIVAAEAAGLVPELVSSLGASMHGATDEALTWLDIETELRAKGVIRARSRISLIGGGGAIGRGMMDEGRDALRAAALRNDVKLVEGPDLAVLLDEVETALYQRHADAPALVINSGGSVAALGTCTDGDRIPHEMRADNAPRCAEGEAGLILREAAKGTPVLHLLNMRGLAADWGLPFDPVPLPSVGNNRAVYGMPTRNVVSAPWPGGTAADADFGRND